MKILHCIHTLDPKAGGVREFVEQVARNQARFSYEIEVASLDRPDAPWLAAFPAKVHALGPGVLKYGITPNWTTWIKANAAQFDAVVINGIWQFSSYGTFLALNGTGVPYFVFPHGMLDKWFAQHYPLKQAKKAVYWNVAEHQVLHGAAAVLFSSEEELARARATFRPFEMNAVVVGEPGAEPTQDIQTLTDKFLQQFPQLQGKRFLLFLGRLHEKKGCDMAISAFASLAADLADLMLVIAGPDDGAEAKLRAQIAALDPSVRDRIMFTGMLGETRWGALAAAEALILPSHQENFGRVVPEALACGTPALISTEVNICSDVKNNGAGLVSADTAAGTQDMLQAFFSQSVEDRQKMKANAKQLFVCRFQSDNFFPRYLSVLKEYSNMKASTGMGTGT